MRLCRRPRDDHAVVGRPVPIAIRRTYRCQRPAADGPLEDIDFLAGRRRQRCPVFVAAPGARPAAPCDRPRAAHPANGPLMRPLTGRIWGHGAHLRSSEHSRPLSSSDLSLCELSRTIEPTRTLRGVRLGSYSNFAKGTWLVNPHWVFFLSGHSQLEARVFPPTNYFMQLCVNYHRLLSVWCSIFLLGGADGQRRQSTINDPPQLQTTVCSSWPHPCASPVTRPCPDEMPP